MLFENVDGWTTMDAWLHYKLTYETPEKIAVIILTV